MSDEDLIYPSDGDGDEDVYDYGSDAEEANAGSGSDSDESGSGSSSSDSSSDSSSSSGSKDDTSLPLNIRLENLFYLAEDKFSEGDYAEALGEFRKIVAMEVEHAEAVAKHRDKWSFQTLQKVCECLIRLGRFGPELEEAYARLLATMNQSYVTANNRDQALDAVLTLIGKPDSKCDKALVAKIYAMTLARLKESNLPLWFKFCYSLAELYLSTSAFERVEELMQELWAYTRRPDGSEDPGKAAAVFQMLALNIDFCQRAGRLGEVKALYDRTIQADMLSTVTDIRIAGRLRENGGMMYMRLREWANAYNDFFKAFSSYNENGNSQAAIRCLRRMVICNILSGSEVNPFDAQELRAYVDQSIEVEAVQRLRVAYQSDDIGHFEFTIMHPVNRISTDAFLREFVGELRFAIQSRVLLQTLIPYTRVSLEFLAKTLSITPEEVEALVVKLRRQDSGSGGGGSGSSSSAAAAGGGDRSGGISSSGGAVAQRARYRFRIDAVRKCVVNPPPADPQAAQRSKSLRQYTAAIKKLQGSFKTRLGNLHGFAVVAARGLGGPAGEM